MIYMNDLPGWAKAMAFLTGTVGFPAVVAAFLLAQSAGLVSGLETKNHELLNGLAISLTEHRVRQELVLERLTLALRVMCENGAKNQTEKNNCGLIR